MKGYRPGGVIVLAIIFIIMQTLGIIIVILIINTIRPQEYFLLSLQAWNWYIISPLLPPGANEISASYEMPLFDTLSRIDYLNMEVWGTLIFLGLSLPVSISLLSMKKWGRYLALIIGIPLIILGILLLILGLSVSPSIMGITSFALGVATVVYLLTEVKYEFK
jgi:hypothetical protein